MSTNIRPDDHETLSALFDGELAGEARLFALRRLGHDDAWQASAGRWQLIGDAMRRQAPIAAPADFASRVGAAVAADARIAPSSVQATTNAPARARRMRWIGGGALAASIALAVTVATLPMGGAPDDAPAPTIAASTPPAPAPVVTARIASSTAPVTPAVAMSEPAPPAAREAVEPIRREVASAPRRVVRTVAAANVPAVAEATLRVGESSNPFNLSADEALTVRPWPRAALGSAPGAFTARYGQAGDSAGERPSFYPFEPRLPADPEAAPTP